MPGLYDEQIRERIMADEDVFARSFTDLAGSVMGDIPRAETEDRVIAKNAIEAILKFYRLPIPEMSDSNFETNTEKQLEFYLARTGLSKRRIMLTPGWYKNSFGAILGFFKDNTPVALIPGKSGGYVYTDRRTGKRMHVSPDSELLQKAYCFYKPFPPVKLTIKDLIRAIFASAEVRDFAILGATVFIAALIGLTTPYITDLLFGHMIDTGNGFVAAACVLAGAAISTLLINIVKAEARERIAAKARISVGAAMFQRILSLPAAFFRNKPPGDLANRLSLTESLCDMLTGDMAVSALTAVFSLIYVGQIFVFTPALVVPALAVILISVVTTLITIFATMKYNRELMESTAAENGITMSLLAGVSKLKLAGAEKRAFGKWAKIFSKQARLRFLPPFMVRFEGVLSVFVTGLGTFILYLAAARNSVSPAEYMAFFAAYGLASGAFMQLASMAGQIAPVKSTLDTIAPLLEELPETDEGGTIVENIGGGIELSNVTFRYEESLPPVLKGLSLKIRPGQYVAIVGATGCGKSTLMRLLLGFEKPQKGAIYYDGRDLAGLNKKSLRKKAVGVVMQNGSLFSGDIFSNITISAPGLTLDDAWAAAEIAGIADDIRAMPMGMNTLISEGTGGVSGGQKQRLMIARAVAARPKILMLDEATSALDNITQKHVTDSLRTLSCTRIVIAHRLSTIKDCDRIIMLEDGMIVEDGTYDELMAHNGRFAELVKRQIAG